MAKKDASTLLSALGTHMSIWTALVSSVRKQGGIDEDICRLAAPDGESVIEQIAALVVQAGKAAQKIIRSSHRLIVDYSKSLEEMIESGKYVRIFWETNDENFPIHGGSQEEVVAHLVCFGRDMSTEQVFEEFESRGLRPASIFELLAFGIAFPEKLYQFSVIALGSACFIGGQRHVPSLRKGSLRQLSLHPSGSWCSEVCFLAVGPHVE